MIRIQHCKNAAEFFIAFETGSKAILQYTVLPGGVLDFHHTETPIDQRGKGIAKLLVQEGLKYASANNLKIIPTCWYVDKYVKEMATDEEKQLAINHNSSI